MSSCGLIDDKTGNDIPSTGMNNTCSQDDKKTISNTFAGISSASIKPAFGTASSIGGGATGFTSPFSATSSTNTSTTGKEKSIFGTGGFGNTPSGIGSTNSSSAFGFGGSSNSGATTFGSLANSGSTSFGSLANTGMKSPSIFGNSKGVGGFGAFGNATNTESVKVNTTFGSLAANATTSSGPSPSIFGQTDRDGFGSFANVNSNTAATKKGLVFGNNTNSSTFSFSAFGGCNGVSSSPSVFGNSNNTANSSASPATTTAFGGTPFTPTSNAFAFTNTPASRGNESDDEDEDNSDTSSGYSSYDSDKQDSNIDANGNDSLSFGGGFASSLNM